jgi:hypothetical protein
VLEGTGMKDRSHIVTAVVTAAAFALSLLIWLHPTLGYASDGVIAGADLRGDLIRLVWVMWGVLMTVRLVTGALMTRFPGRKLYISAAGGLAVFLLGRLALHVFDKLY